MWEGARKKKKKDEKTPEKNNRRMGGGVGEGKAPEAVMQCPSEPSVRAYTNKWLNSCDDNVSVFYVIAWR